MKKLEQLIGTLCREGVEFKALGEVMIIVRGASQRPIRSFFVSVLLFLFLSISYSHVAHAQSGDFTALCYHDVIPTNQGDLSPNQYAISPANLLAQFEWLKVNGFHPISIDDLLNAQKGIKPLPEKPILLSFDDGYTSMYTIIFPLLRLYDFPAVFALVGSWLEVPEGEHVLYGNIKVPREKFLSFQQIKEIQASGLVEFASHSYDLHHGILANPQGNTEPAAVTRLYSKATNSYETDAEFHTRIRSDFIRNSKFIEKHTGKRPRVMVWPYGAYSLETVAIAESTGMSITLTLEDNTPSRLSNLKEIHRDLMFANPKTDDLAYMLNHVQQPQAERMIHVDLDYIYDEDPIQQGKNLDMLLDRVKNYNIDTVYLQAFADPDGDGDVNALYFPNRHLPMRADLFNRVAWQLQTRAGVNVYAWMPVLAFDLGDATFSRLGVKEFRNGELRDTTSSYKRLSPFHPEARKIINEIYADLGRHANFYGLLFHDDAYLTDFEDFSDDALQWYAQKGITASVDEMVSNPDLVKQLSEIKTDYLISFTKELSDTVRIYEPNLRTARNMYALPVLQPESEQWFAQNLEKFVANYDTTAIMAMPYMEKASDPKKWFTQLLAAVKKRIPPFDHKNPRQPNFSKVLFELQSKNWHTDTHINDAILVEQIRYLLENGVNNIGYYPDNFHDNQPNMEKIRSVFSLQTFPYIRK